MRYLASLLILALALVPRAHATAYLVNPEGTGDFPTIQTAIDSVLDGDVIMLTDGMFSGAANHNLDLGGKAITVCSRSGNAQACVIDCGQRNPAPADLHRGFFFRSGEDSLSVVRGITIANGTAAAT